MVLHVRHPTAGPDATVTCKLDPQVGACSHAQLVQHARAKQGPQSQQRYAQLDATSALAPWQHLLPLAALGSPAPVAMVPATSLRGVFDLQGASSPTDYHD